MKRTIIILFTLYFTSSFAGVDCIDNSEHLRKSYDDKEWHSVMCECNCEVIKAGYCAECKHLQNAHPLTVISSKTKKVVAKQLSVHQPKTLQDFFDNRVMPYLQNK